jgi:putative transposase
VKYRKELLHGELGDYIKTKNFEVAEHSSFEIDKDHVDILLKISPAFSVSSYVRRIKQSTRQSVRGKFKWLKKQFWNENTFKNKGRFSDSSQRRRFASNTGFSRKFTIKAKYA